METLFDSTQDLPATLDGPQEFTVTLAEQLHEFAAGMQEQMLPGVDGVVFIPAVSEEGDLSWTNNGGLQNPETVNVVGPEGPAGAVFVPSVTADGDLSWTNNGALANPEPVNIMGPEGPQGPVGPAGSGGSGTPGEDLQEISNQELLLLWNNGLL